jgi:hypothetical protein
MRQFKIADEFGDNYSESIARIMCNVKFLPQPSWDVYEDEIGEEKFWKYALEGKELTYENKERVWCDHFVRFAQDGGIANSCGDDYFSTLQEKRFVFTLDDHDDFPLFDECLERFASDEDVSVDKIKEFVIDVLVTPEDWTFEGRSAGYYSVMFDVDSNVSAKWIDTWGDEQYTEVMSVDDLVDDWIDECWDALGNLYLESDAVTMDIDDAIMNYIDALAENAKCYIYDYEVEAENDRKRYAVGGGK